MHLFGELDFFVLLVLSKDSDLVVFEIDVLPPEAVTTIVAWITEDFATSNTGICKDVRECAVAKFLQCIESFFVDGLVCSLIGVAE